jgi:tripartite-type tricarboxylate transporter receptor subunit TctC
MSRAEPDGYTIFVTTNTSHSANPYLLKNMTYDPIKDFTPIARTGDLPFMLVIDPKLPVNSVADLIALAKKEPGNTLMPAAVRRPSSPARPLRRLQASTCCTFPAKAHRPHSPT